MEARFGCQFLARGKHHPVISRVARKADSNEHRNAPQRAQTCPVSGNGPVRAGGVLDGDHPLTQLRTARHTLV